MSQAELDALASRLRSVELGLNQARAHAIGAAQALKSEIENVDRARRTLKEAIESLRRCSREQPSVGGP